MLLTVSSVFLRGLEFIRVCDTFFYLVFNWISVRFRSVLGSVLGCFLSVKTVPETIRVSIPF